MIEPTMKAIAPSTKCRSRISTAAARLSTRPVIEIAFGVSRDSISALAGELPASSPFWRRGGRLRRRAARSSLMVRSLTDATYPPRGRRLGPQAAASPGAGRNAQRAGRSSASRWAAQRGRDGDERPGGGVEPVVVGGDDDDREDEQRVERPEHPPDRVANDRHRGPGDHQGEPAVHARHRRVLVDQQADGVAVLLDRGEAGERVGESLAGEHAAAAPSAPARSRPGRSPSRP